MLCSLSLVPVPAHRQARRVIFCLVRWPAHRRASPVTFCLSPLACAPTGQPSLVFHASLSCVELTQKIAIFERHPMQAGQQVTVARQTAPHISNIKVFRIQHHVKLEMMSQLADVCRIFVTRRGQAAMISMHPSIVLSRVLRFVLYVPIPTHCILPLMITMPAICHAALPCVPTKTRT